MAEEKRAFEAEVGKILKIVANSLYSEKEVFLRELISNASDACDRLRYQALTKPELKPDDAQLRVTLALDKKARTLTVSDNGIGMDHDELVENLGTIARSGTTQFLDQLTGDDGKDVALIGQFGVGFYSAFMVAREVEVISRRAGEEAAWRWLSDGAGEFTVAPAQRPGRGTTIVLRLKRGENEYLEPERIGAIVKTHSDHIALPIVLLRDGEEKTLNAASALWTRPKKDISEAQYTEFYRHVGHAFDEPWLTVHTKAEGRIEYTSLIFVPTVPPLDLFDPVRKHGVKLYVRRVYVADECEGLVPPYLRFLRGIVDSEDLPLNVSREMLQNNPLVAKISTAIVKRVLAELGKRADREPEEYATFWASFGAVLKEGIYEDGDQRARLLKLARFRSTQSAQGLVSLDDYVGRMREGQEAIYYIVGEEAEALARSPQLEGFAARGIEVLLFADPVDAFWVNAVSDYDEKPLRSANQGAADLDKIALEGAKDEAEAGETVAGAELGTLIAILKQNLGEEIQDVRASLRLTDSAVCLVAGEGAMDMHLERIMRQHNRATGATPRILEINPRHPLIRAMAARGKDKGAADKLADASRLLLDQARIVEGEPVTDAAAFSRRLAEVMTKGLAG